MRLEWTVPADHPAFAGHFPGRPIVPGVVLLDRGLQLAERLQPHGRWGIAQAKFLRTVGPGETLVFTLAETRPGLWALEVRASQLVASAVLRREAP